MLYSESTDLKFITSLNIFTDTSRITFDQTTGDYNQAKLLIKLTITLDKDGFEGPGIFTRRKT